MEAPLTHYEFYLPGGRVLARREYLSLAWLEALFTGVDLTTAAWRAVLR
jgi:hypothetical protein